MVNDAAQQGRAQIELVLNTAVAYLNQGNVPDAQRLLLRGKLDAQAQGLEDLVHAVNRNFAVSHQMQASAHYETGKLEAAVDAYQQANHAFTEFDASFGTPEERGIKQQWLTQLFPYWADSCFKLAVNAHNRGNMQISEAAAKLSGKERIPAVLQGLGSWDAALRWYNSTLQAANNAAKAGVQVDAGFVTLPQQRIAEISNAAVGWANVIRNPKLAEKYLRVG